MKGKNSLSSVKDFIVYNSAFWSRSDRSMLGLNEFSSMASVRVSSCRGTPCLCIKNWVVAFANRDEDPGYDLGIGSSMNEEREPFL